MQPVISVLLTTYHRPELLKLAINSVLRQDFNNFELLILDDASADNTSEVVHAFKDSHIRYLRQKKNVGFTKNFRNGISKAKGRYIFLLSDDDMIVYSHTLSHVVGQMGKTGAGVGAMSLFFYENDPMRPNSYTHLKHSGYVPPSQENIIKTVDGHFGFMSGLIYRRDLIKLNDIEDDLWVAHLKPFLKILVSHGLYYFSDLYILAKNSTTGNISHLDVWKNRGYHLLRQFAMYRELDRSEKRYRQIVHQHVIGVANSLLGIKYFTSTQNMIAITQLLILTDVSILMYWRLYLSFLSALVVPKWLLNIIRQKRIRHFESAVTKIAKARGIIKQVRKIKIYEETLFDDRNQRKKLQV
ncbi:MAG: glycosyltransferase family 2 protein [Candidatus Roizmanbacteria bacterium]|nr:glycosyltransferase family 2 protein [Candidatus Roizmanbacteria bacterium]